MRHLILIAVTFLSLNMFAQSKASSAFVKNEIEILQKAGLELSEIQIQRISMVLNENYTIMQKNETAFKGNKSLLATKQNEVKALNINNIKGALNTVQLQKFNELKLEEKL